MPADIGGLRPHTSPAAELRNNAAQMRRLKAFGKRVTSKDPDRQAAEIHTRIALMNRFSALGQAEIVRVA